EPEIHVVADFDGGLPGGGRGGEEYDDGERAAGETNVSACHSVLTRADGDRRLRADPDARGRARYRCAGRGRWPAGTTPGEAARPTVRPRFHASSPGMFPAQRQSLRTDGR